MECGGFENKKSRPLYSVWKNENAGGVLKLPFFEVYHAEKIDGVWEQRLRIHYNCVGEITVPKMLSLPIPDVTVNTRKGVFVNYVPAEIAGWKQQKKTSVLTAFQML